MRRTASIARTTALEILSEPLSLLVTLSAIALALLAPVLHYHQFGEATRMARDAGFSSLFLGGWLFAVFGCVKSFRRELESGTWDMALAHSVSRRGLFLAKALGAFLAYLVFSAIIGGVSFLMIEGAWIGGVIAERTGELPRVFGPCVAGATAILLVPLVLGAALNRFARFRFVLSAMVIAFILSVLPLAAMPILNSGIARCLPVAALILETGGVFIAAAAAFSVRFRANAAVSAVVLAAAAALPVAGNYYLADSLSRGGTVPCLYFLAATAATLPAVLAFLLLGIRFAECDIINS